MSEVVRRQLGNGARVVIQEHRASAVAALQLWVSAGGRDEAPTELGLAHYLEHMLFKGTPSRPSGFIEREVEGVGGRMNAGTSFNYTYYHAVLPARRAVAGVELLADIASNASLDEGTLEREKLVVLEEVRRSEDNPRRHLMRHLYALALEGHQSSSDRNPRADHTARTGDARGVLPPPLRARSLHARRDG